MYNFEKAQVEAGKIKELVGKEGKLEDYLPYYPKDPFY